MCATVQFMDSVKLKQDYADAIKTIRVKNVNTEVHYINQF